MDVIKDKLMAGVNKKVKLAVFALILLGAVAIVDFGQNAYADNNIPDCKQLAGETTCTFEEGGSRSITVGSKIYEVAADFVGSTTVKLTVDGELTPVMKIGFAFLLADGTTIKVNKIIIKEDGGRLVEFTIYLPTYSVNIMPGWNMVGVKTTEILRESNCRNIYENVYVFYPQIKDYKLYSLDKYKLKATGALTIIGNDDLIYAFPKVTSQQSSMWVYSYDDALCVLNVSFSKRESLSVSRGWNMLSVPPNWADRKVSDAIDVTGCEFNRGFEFNSDEGWKFVTSDTVFRKDQVGKGFWAYFTGC